MDLEPNLMQQDDSIDPEKSTIMKVDIMKPRRTPPVKSMVNKALRMLVERRGCTFHAIKKYIASNYDVDITRKTTYIKRYITASIGKGSIIRTKGVGFSGRFRLKPKPKRRNTKRQREARERQLRTGYNSPAPTVSRTLLLKVPNMNLSCGDRRFSNSETSDSNQSSPRRSRSCASERSLSKTLRTLLAPKTRFHRRYRY